MLLCAMMWWTLWVSCYCVLWCGELFERHVTVCYDVVNSLSVMLLCAMMWWTLWCGRSITVYIAFEISIPKLGTSFYSVQEVETCLPTKSSGPLKTMTSLKHFSTADVCILTYPSVKLQCVFEWCPRWKNLQEIENNEYLVGRAAERIREAQGKYKKWAQDCARRVWGHAPRKYWDLECVLGTHEVPFRTHMHTSRLLFFISSFRLKRDTS